LITPPPPTLALAPKCWERYALKSRCSCFRIIVSLQNDVALVHKFSLLERRRICWGLANRAWSIGSLQLLDQVAFTLVALASATCLIFGRNFIGMDKLTNSCIDTHNIAFRHYLQEKNDLSKLWHTCL
jgi:hypothetical protein